MTGEICYWIFNMSIAASVMGLLVLLLVVLGNSLGGLFIPCLQGLRGGNKA